MFDSDDDDNNEKDYLWKEDEFKAKKSKKVSVRNVMFYFSWNNGIDTIYLFVQITLGNDARFTLDDHFMEDDRQTEESKPVEGTDECDLQKEKERQLDILESILGTPLTTKNQETKPTK